jgi:hypothetical protein
MTLDEQYERVGWAELGQRYVHHEWPTPPSGMGHETGGLGAMLQPIVAEALADEGVSAQLSLLVADTLRAPEVDAALNRVGMRLAAWTAGGIVVGLLAGHYLRRRF